MNALWCIDRGYLDGLLARADWSTLMADADPLAIEAMYAARAAATAGPGGIGVVPVYGTLTRRDTLLSLLFGGTSTNRVTQQVNALAADDTIGTILMLVDSPGGQASGITEAAAAIRQARQAKPVVALATGVMASAAAWLGWQASEVVAAPDAIVGSQGVFGVHMDTSKALEAAGIRPTYIASSEAKVGGMDGLPLDDDTRAELQALVDEQNRLFVADTAAGRGITPAQVRETYGNGAVFHAREAKGRGMVDRVESYPQTIARLSGVRQTGARAEADPVDLTAQAEAEAGLVSERPRTAALVAETRDKDEGARREVYRDHLEAGDASPSDVRATEALRARFELDRDAWLLNS